MSICNAVLITPEPQWNNRYIQNRVSRIVHYIKRSEPGVTSCNHKQEKYTHRELTKPETFAWGELCPICFKNFLDRYNK